MSDYFYNSDILNYNGRPYLEKNLTPEELKKFDERVLRTMRDLRKSLAPSKDWEKGLQRRINI
jgi:hypothetical protein